MAQSRLEELEKKIKELENEIVILKSAAPKREKIAEMSTKVVDSNPYR